MPTPPPVAWIESLDRRLEALSVGVSDIHTSLARTENLQESVDANTEASEKLTAEVGKISRLLDNHSTEIKRVEPIHRWFEDRQRRIDERRAFLNGTVSILKLFGVIGTLSAAVVAVLTFLN